MKRIKNNIGLILYFIIVVLLTILMFWAIEKKEGFHEDEIFSYGASNSTLGNNYLSYGRIDNIDTIIKSRNPFLTLKNFIYYRIINKDAYNNAVKNLNRDDYKSVWRTKEDAIEYLQIDNFEEAIDFGSVYWNTAKDVHPPLFYFIVHFVSIFFWGKFSKYIIFIINLLFYIGTLYLLRKILILIEKKHLVIPNLILYGASIGAISTVMFQRMYMMLTFFTSLFLYINLKIYYNNFILTSRLKKEFVAVIVLGFLTQYNFCFYAAFIAMIMFIMGIQQNNKMFLKNYILQILKSAIIGILIFPPSIYHIFFSYRGGGRNARSFTIYEAFIGFCKNIFNAFSITYNYGKILVVILIIIFIVKFINSKSKKVYVIITMPTILTFVMMIILSPYKSLRYVMFLLPIISMGFVILMDDFIDNKKFSTIVLALFSIYLSIYGLFLNPINYLYKGYQNYLAIAEKYKEDRFVLVVPTVFSHIQDIPEFQIYNESLIIAPDRLDDLQQINEFNSENEVILGIKNWINDSVEEVLDDVMKYTGYDNYEFLYTSDKSAKMTIYRLYR